MRFLLCLGIGWALLAFGDVNLEELETKGCTVVYDLITDSERSLLAESFFAMREKAMGIVAAHDPLPRFFSENNAKTESVYWRTEDRLILQAGKGRYDFYRGFHQDLTHPEILLANVRLSSLMKDLLVDEYTCYIGGILSEMGSEAQYWHRDTDTLSSHGSGGDELVLLDDFYFTVLIPLTVPFTKENGATEFFLGSHRKPAGAFKECPLAQAEVPLNAALIFNGKINHRGGANRSSEDRPALYMVFHKKWYNDQYRRGIP